MNQIAWPPVVEAWQQLKALSDDDEARRLADVRERALKAELTEIAAAERRGEARGEARGVALGEARGAAKVRQELLQTLIADGMSEADARTLLHLP